MQTRLVGTASLRSGAPAAIALKNLRRRVGPPRAGHFGLRAHVNETPLFSLGENAIAKEPGSSYPERWRCVSRLGASMVAVAPSRHPVCDSEPGSVFGLITGEHRSGDSFPDRVFPVCNSEL